MRTIVNILQKGNSQEIETLTKQANFNEIESPLLFCNLKPISYAALCGNLEIVDYLIKQGCYLEVAKSSDCNLLTWAIICSDKQVSSNLINYIDKNTIYESFNDGTQAFHLKYLTNSSFEELNFNDSEYLSFDGLSPFYYMLLSPQFPFSFTTNKLYELKLHHIINSNLNTRTEDKIRRLARYYYITGYYLGKHQLRALAIESFSKAIDHFKLLNEMHSNDLKELSYIYFSLGKMHYKSSQWESATECYKNAVIIHNRIEISEKSLIDHQDLTNYRTSLAGYLHDDVDEVYFSRYIDF